MSTQNTSPVLQKVNTLQVAMNEDYVQNQLKAALADNSAGFAASLVDLFTTDSYLQACDPKQVIMQAMKAAMLKLPINKSLGFAYIIAYGGKPEFQIGYKGLIQLALRTGKYKILNADMVYQGEYRTKNKLTGEFDLSGEATSDNVIGYFAYFEMKNGFSKTLFMSKEKVTAHAKKYSKSFTQANGPWTKEFDAMAIKTVLKNLISHWGELSTEVINVLDKEDIADTIQDEVGQNGNKKEMAFNNVTEAEVVHPQQQQQQNFQPQPNGQQQVAPF